MIKQPVRIRREAISAEAAPVVALWHSCGLTRLWNDAASDFARAVTSSCSRRGGLSRALMTAAEAWLIARGVPKIQSVVRDGSDGALAFHGPLRLGRQLVATLSRFLGEQGA